ncbi:MAG: hypothetical protein PF636_06885 [Actinomycetota bacterium]|jgi:tetratricopeptide (TPR) repeat protein|nr:hypothetical protein [Actinomycetota bacterium]
MPDSRQRSSEPSSSQTGQDRPTRIIVISIMLVIISIFTVVLWAVAGGVFQRLAPRTFVERQIDMLEGVVAEKPGSEEAWADYALSLIAAKQYSRADSVLDDAEVVLGDQVIDIIAVRAHLASVRGDDGQALELIQNAITAGLEFRASELARLAEQSVYPDPQTIKGPVLAGAYAFEARLLAAQGLWAEAETAYSGALEEEPASADALVARGAVYIEMSSVESATADFQRALEFIPGFAPALEGLERIEKGSE